MLKFKRIKLTPQRHSKVQIILIKNEKLIAFLVISYFSIMFLGHLIMDIFQILRFPWKHVDNILANMMWIFKQSYQKRLVQFKSFSYKMKRSYIEFEHKFDMFRIRPMSEYHQEIYSLSLHCQIITIEYYKRFCIL